MSNYSGDIRGTLDTDCDFIYGLLHPTAPIDFPYVRYVGRTLTPFSRFHEHIKEEKETKKDDWLDTLHSQGIKPRLVILEQCPIPDGEIREEMWIRKCLAEGALLVNTRRMSLQGVHSDALKKPVKMPPASRYTERPAEATKKQSHRKTARKPKAKRIPDESALAPNPGFSNSPYW